MTRKEELVTLVTKEELYEYWVIKNYTYPKMMEQFNLNKRWELTYLLRYYNFPRKDNKLIGDPLLKSRKKIGIIRLLKKKKSGLKSVEMLN